jgi:hypothetical protein
VEFGLFYEEMLTQVIWELIRDREKRGYISLKRINDEYQHENGSYYYIWEVYRKKTRKLPFINYDW